MNSDSALTYTSILSVSVKLMNEAGYKDITPDTNTFWSSTSTRLFEDQYGIVCLVLYETWDNLTNEWQEAQGQLVDLISSYIKKNEPKAWDSYLVLLTPSKASNNEELDLIRYDTTRARKIIATGRELTSNDSLEYVLAPLMPLKVEVIDDNSSDVLSQLPRIIEDEANIKSDLVKVIVDSFSSHQSIIEDLDNYRKSNKL